METSVLMVNDLHCGYGEDLIVQVPSLHLELGSFSILKGSNGSGKSTFIKTILGQLTSLSGAFTWGIPSESISYIPQALPVDVSAPITVEDLVKTGFITSSKAHKIAIKEALSNVHLLDQRHKRLRHLSGGQQRRALFARALAQKPLCYILDEPTVNMDQESETLLGDLLHRLVFEDNRAVIATSHVEAWVKESHIWHIKEGVLHG